MGMCWFSPESGGTPLCPSLLPRTRCPTRVVIVSVKWGLDLGVRLCGTPHSRGALGGSLWLWIIWTLVRGRRVGWLLWGEPLVWSMSGR
jgi:hypothetical protein